MRLNQGEKPLELESGNRWTTRKTILRAGLVLVGVLLLVVGWLHWTHMRALQTPLHIGNEPILLVVKPGMSLRSIARELSERNILPHPLSFVWEAVRQGRANQIKVGEYQLKPGLTPRQLLDALVQGKVLQRTLTIIEGWNFRELMQAIRANQYLTHTLEQDLSHEAIMQRIGLPDHHPEGRFYPDTYHFPRGTFDVTFLKRAYLTMERRLLHAWEKRAAKLPYQNPSDALTLASIVEKETGNSEERARIAGVFVRRLQRGMRLQSDPTVIYGMGTSFTGNLRRVDLRKPTPYNTYTEKGLPPTPIAMPGGAAIHAALHPASGNELFFVAKGDGSHYFSTTFKEHKRAVVRYQLRRRKK
uniref:Endolytic murein transglycosylase n=1 Tax=Candidatus Kentrum sp. MB TaxID=2138164 RepID=A0A450XI11_9GAMM|nr:MAG: UPF0755 protein [Candidatus Kentron sp. MB]VFK28884.1 MAG: UPF0755 protein [Candidatus Kentron sp. MB]VFK74133.1 MAG: UPF0755 protein [Candidatus Kentron sp. MB]